MEDQVQSGQVARVASEAQAAEATLAKQLEDHTLPAGQVLGEQRDLAVNDLANCAFIP